MIRQAKLKAASIEAASVQEVAEFSHHGLEHFGKNWRGNHVHQGAEHHAKHAAAHLERAEHYEGRELEHVRKAREHHEAGRHVDAEKHDKYADEYGHMADKHNAWAERHHAHAGSVHASVELAYRIPTAHENLKSFGKNSASHAKSTDFRHHAKHASAHAKLVRYHTKKQISTGRKIDRLQGMMERHGKNHRNFHKWKTAHKAANKAIAHHTKLIDNHSKWVGMHQTHYLNHAPKKPKIGKSAPMVKNTKRPANRMRKLKQRVHASVKTETAATHMLRHFGKNAKFHEVISDPKHHLDHAHEHLATAKHHHESIMKSEHPHEVLEHTKKRNHHAKWAETHIQHFHGLTGRHAPVHASAEKEDKKEELVKPSEKKDEK